MSTSFSYGEPAEEYGLQSASEPVSYAAAPVGVDVNTDASAEIMQAQELAIADARREISRYAGYPGVSQALEEIITSNSGNPEQLTALLKQMTDQIEVAQTNPNSNQPVHPAIAKVVEDIRNAEAERREAEQKALAGVMGGLFAVAGAAAAVPAAMAMGGGQDREPEQYVLNDRQRSDQGNGYALLGDVPRDANLPGQMRQQGQGRFA